MISKITGKPIPTSLHPVKEFLQSFRKDLAECPFQSPENISLIEFLDWLIENVKPEALIDSNEDSLFIKNINWHFWCRVNDNYKRTFLGMLETIPH